MIFLSPLDALIPKFLFSFFLAEFRVRATSGPPGVSLGRILGGPSIEAFGGGGASHRALSIPPPEARLPLVWQCAACACLSECHRQALRRSHHRNDALSPRTISTVTAEDVGQGSVTDVALIDFSAPEADRRDSDLYDAPKSAVQCMKFYTPDEVWVVGGAGAEVRGSLGELHPFLSPYAPSSPLRSPLGRLLRAAAAAGEGDLALG